MALGQVAGATQAVRFRRRSDGHGDGCPAPAVVRHEFFLGLETSKMSDSTRQKGRRVTRGKDHESPKRTNQPFTIVGVGASAGGLEALETFFAGVASNSGLGYVVVQHLSPDFKSMMGELLSRHTNMPILSVEDGLEVKPDHVYLLPPRKEMIVSDGRLLLTDRGPSEKLNLPIDTFLRSLAQNVASQAAAVVLSGTGSDGSRGVRAIREAGGLVVVQSPETAQFDGMPKASIDTGCVDLVLDPREMGAVLVRFAGGQSLGRLGTSDKNPDPMRRLFDMLREQYSLDFAFYRTNTVSRRIERRLQLLHDENLPNYLSRLEDDPDELEQLYRDLLIGVTRFFRDSEAFDRLVTRVIPEIFDTRSDCDDEIRVWVAACGTGEEAYSVAILLDEEAQRRGWGGVIKVFATDVHRRSIESAGLGLYSAEQMAEFEPDRRERYFDSVGGLYQVTPRLRQMIVFATHNVLRDAPFTKLDLVTCRNMLIYLRTEAQQKVLSLFHFGLRTGGILMLGSSESPGDLSDEFQPVDPHWKIYRKRRDVSLLSDVRLTSPSLPPSLSPGLGVTQQVRAIDDVPRLVERQVVAAYEQIATDFIPPSFVVNARCDLVYSTAGAHIYLKPLEGFTRAGLLECVDRDLRTALSGLLQRAAREQRKVACRGVTLDAPEGRQVVDVWVKPIDVPGIDHGFFVITIIDQTPQQAAAEPEGMTLTSSQVDQSRMETLENELRHTRENLQATIEELETSNEELQAANEELVASNEELQSTNEELHSVNEELHSVNAEHQRKITELMELTEDLENLFQSTDSATLFLDGDLCIRKFSTGIGQIFRVVADDIGRPIDAFRHTLEYPDLLDDLKHVIAGGTRIEKEVLDTQGVPYLVQLNPYRSRVGAIGLVLSLVDLSLVRETQQRLEESERLYRSTFENASVGIARIGLDGAWLEVNQRLCQIVGYSKTELFTLKFQDITHLDDVDIDAGKLSQLVCGAIDRYSVQKRFRVKNRSEVWVNLTVSLQRDNEGKPLNCISVIQDITPRKRFEAELQRAIDQRDKFLAMLSHELRNPLAALLHAARLLDRRRRGGKGNQPLDVLLRQAEQIRSLLDDLLDVSRVTQNKIVLQCQPIDLVCTAYEAAEAIQPQIDARSHLLTLSMSDTPIWVDADRTRVLQVIENLLSNSAKYTPTRGAIELRVAESDGEAIIEVSDNGRGLAPELLTHVFDMFVQADGSQQFSGGGMGLGLTLVKSIVELHGGTVSATSPGLDRGSTFSIRLPRCTQPSQPAVQDSGGVLRVKVRRVVLVEDEDDAREMLAESLRLDGYEVVTAEDGDRGLAAILQECPDVALVDVALPGLTGYEIATQVRKTLTREQVKLVAMTGFGRDTDRLKAFEAGFDEHLVKPARPEDLERVLTKPVDEIRDQN